MRDDHDEHSTADPQDRPGRRSAPAPVTATGQPSAAPSDGRAQAGRVLTTAQGARLRDTDHSLKAGPRGPVLLQDHHLREKITHFDHERIPERVVHARGAAAHGVFESYGTASELTRARFLAEASATPVFVRFSTVLGSRGSADTVRDTRGFATKFYTDEGVFDLVGNNIPVFFIQDGIKFPDIIHAAKPQPDREIPQAQSAHDTFWDFVSLHPEAQAHTIWNMSDRGIPRSFRTMEGFGIHTFRLINARDESCLVKFHWKPAQGVHSLVWEEAQMLSGMDPDFHRRDLADAIDAGAFPQWELGVQVFPDTVDQMFEGIDLLDPTKIVPEERAPVRPLGRLVLNANPQNYFEETEQVAFHPGHLVPGIDVTDDPLLQVRLFSYLDTQITRLGGPNFGQIPINRTHAPVNDMLRDGMHQSAVHTGVAPYRPNSLDGGCPFHAGAEDAPFIDFPEAVPATHKLRENPVSFEDHYSQVTLFYRSLSPIERQHVIAAYTFELGKCREPEVRRRQLAQLACVDADLCSAVADGLGLPVPEAEQAPTDPEPSPALSQVTGSWPVAGRTVALVVDAHTDISLVVEWRRRLAEEGVRPLVVAPDGSPLADGSEVDRTYLTGRSVEFDALVFLLSGGEPAGAEVLLLISEAYRHAKAIAVDPAGDLLDQVGIDPEAPGVVVADAGTAAGRLLTLLAGHRVWQRLAPTNTTKE